MAQLSQLCCVYARQTDKRAEPVDEYQQKGNRQPRLQLFNLEDIFDCFDKLFHTIILRELLPTHRLFRLLQLRLSKMR